MKPLVERNILLLLVVLLAILGGMWFISERLFTHKATIAGTIDYNGTAPSGASVAIQAKKLGERQYQTIASGLTPTSNTKWSWTEAEQGAAYQLQATVQDNGQNIATSQTITAAAPASGEILVINSTAGPTQDTATIAGIVDMNGPVPDQSTIAIGTKLPSETQYTLVVTDLQATDGVQWSWNEAQSGLLYDVKAFLQVNGENLYESETERVAAPASGEILTLNARPTPQPTPTQATIQGTINLNGPSPSNSSIMIVARRTGTTQFNTVVSNINTANGAGWSWGNANAGVSYDLQAWVMAGNSTLLQSQILTVTAPASNEILTINNASNQYPAPPGSSMTSSCNSFNNNSWQVSFSYNNNGPVQGAQQYQITAGTSSGSNQTLSTVLTPNTPNQSNSYTSGNIFSPNQTYYAQYAYSPCTNCNIWSAFSSPIQFSCSTPSNTPTPSVTSAPTNTPTPTATPTPTLPPMTSACNQTCESNGYACALGLQCVSGDLPGSQVCRNPNCTDRTDCRCRLLQ